MNSQVENGEDSARSYAAPHVPRGRQRRHGFLAATETDEYAAGTADAACAGAAAELHCPYHGSGAVGIWTRLGQQLHPLLHVLRGSCRIRVEGGLLR